ncbi:YhgE/Pip domain-containing protein [Corynebacterium sputi]|uniref:YhgE/Pip domain-containing protein n=1 Tax=Corynebacterium sputi TaxID=489915 RepID=UPI000415E4CA|nr:DUF3533 domain-containing protein [Corynebacterium sputi]
MNKIEKLAQQNQEIQPRSRVNFKFWVIPVAAVTLVMSLLGLVYLGGNLNPQKNLEDFPVAVVNQDVGAEMANEEFRNIGDELVSQLQEQAGDQFDLHVLNTSEADNELNRGEVYGALVIPQDFTMQVNSWAINAVLSNEVAQPTLTIVDNPGAGIGAGQIMDQFGTQATDQISSTIGEQLSEQVQAVADEMDVELSGVAAATVADPVKADWITNGDFGDGDGFGLSAFFWALLLVLGGFTGAAITNVLVDGRLGVLPIEAGPLFKMRRHLGISRLMTLLAKFGFVILQSMAVAGVYVWIGSSIGMTASSFATLWFYSALMIAAVGIAAQSVNALFGNAGLVINLIFFVVLGLPSAGATLPLESVPKFFQEISPMMPLHQIYLGTRSILFFDGQWGAGLGPAMFWALGGAVVWFIIGVIGTWLYDRWGFTRAIPGINTLPDVPVSTSIDSTGDDEAVVSEDNVDKDTNDDIVAAEGTEK